MLCFWSVERAEMPHEQGKTQQDQICPITGIGLELGKMAIKQGKNAKEWVCFHADTCTCLQP